MKILTVVFVLLFSFISSYAEVPGTISFQGYLSDNAGNPVNVPTDISFTIPGINWNEDHFGVSVNKGIFSVVLGNQLSLADVDFGQVLQLHIIVNGISQSIPISSVPYAFHAKTVEHDSDILQSLSCASGQVAESNGSTWLCADKATGPEGKQGETGIKGEKGEQGIKGDAGSQGEKGLAGQQGIKGDKGEQGLQGVIGATGTAGLQGLKGDKGESGSQGIAGSEGSRGLQGEKGEQGIKGDAGLAGQQGIKGEQGSLGDLSQCRICIYWSQDYGNKDHRMMCIRMIDNDHSGIMNLDGKDGKDDTWEMRFKCDGGSSGVWNDWDH